MKIKKKLFIYALATTELVLLLFIIIASFDAMKVEFTSILPITPPLLADLANLFFVIILSASLFLSTDITTYFIGVMINAKHSGLKDLHGQKTDFLTYIGQTIVAMSLAFFTFFTSLHLTTTGAILHSLKEEGGLKDFANFTEISLKFQNQKNEITRYYDSLKLIEQKKYNRLISLNSVEMAQKLLAQLEENKQNALKMSEKQRKEEIDRLRDFENDFKEEKKIKEKRGKYIGGVLESMAILCSIALRIFSKKEEISDEFKEISNEISKNKNEISEEITKYYDLVGKGKKFKTQKQLANHLGISEVKISRAFKEYEKNREKSKTTKYGDWAESSPSNDSVVYEWKI